MQVCTSSVEVNVSNVQIYASLVQVSTSHLNINASYVHINSSNCMSVQVNAIQRISVQDSAAWNIESLFSLFINGSLDKSLLFKMSPFWRNIWLFKLDHTY